MPLCAVSCARHRRASPLCHVAVVVVAGGAIDRSVQQGRRMGLATATALGALENEHCAET